MKKHLTPLLLLALVGACTTDDPGRRAEPVLEGHFGDIEDFEGDPDLHEAYFWGDTTYLDMRTRGSGWALMAALTLDGRLGEGELAPGSVVHVTAPDDWYYEDDYPAATMLGCSGPVDDEWWTDCSPDDIVIQIDEGSQDGTVLMTFDATFPPDCGGIVGPPGTEPGWPGDPAEPPPGTEPGDPGEPPPGAEPGEPPSDEPIEPLPASAPTASGEAQVISGVIEIRLADIIEDGGDWGSPEPVILDGPTR